MSTVEDDEQDLTRKQRREQARAQRKEIEQAEAASAQRRRRLTQLGIVVAVVVVAIVAIAIAAGGSSKSHGPAKGGKETEKLVAGVEALFGHIPQSGNSIGSPTAPVTLQYFGDLQCPICRDFSLGALPPLIQNQVRAGKLRIEYRSLETATREPETFRAQQIAALAAGKQNKLWQYIELFYDQQGEEGSSYVTQSYLQKLAQQVPGLNLSQWSAARSNAELASQVTADAQAANNAGFTGTPSFLIGKTGGAFKRLEYSSLTDPSSFNSAIEALAKG